MNRPIILTNGEHEVRIYTVRNRGRLIYQLSFYEGGKRERKTFGKLSVARREAKLVLSRLAVNRHDAAEFSTADIESYVVAKRHADTTGLPVHVCVELFARAHARLKGCGLLDAVDFFMEFNRGYEDATALPQLVADFAASRVAMGAHPDYVRNINRQLTRLVKDLPRAAIGQYRTADLDRWLGSQDWQPVTKNDVRKILITFGNWAKARGHLPRDRPTEFAGMVGYKVPATKIEIYSPEELRKILEAVRAHLPELLPWAACAAFTGARTKELELLRWESINFERGFLEVASTKIRTKARRLVPLHDALKAWLTLCRQKAGPLTDYVDPRAALRRVAWRARLALKDNAFRHSYITYRVAETNDTARVALECGTSPEIIFQHYRELVGPDDAAEWFGAFPAMVAPANQPNVENCATRSCEPDAQSRERSTGVLRSAFRVASSEADCVDAGVCGIEATIPASSAAVPEPLWTINEVAAFLRCTVRHVHNLIPAGLPHCYLGRLLRFDPNEIRAHLQKKRRLDAM